MEFSIFNIWLNKIYHLLKKKKTNLAQGQQNGRKARKTKSLRVPLTGHQGQAWPPSLKEAGLFALGYQH